MENLISNICKNRIPIVNKSLYIYSDEILEYIHWTNGLSASFLKSNSIMSLNRVIMWTSIDFQLFLEKVTYCCIYYII